MLPDRTPLVAHTTTLRSRYSETDKMGYVYYGHYLQYFEVARTEFTRHTGVVYRDLEDNGVMLPVVKAEVWYKKPVLYDEEMRITLFMYDLPDVRLDTWYEIRVPRLKHPCAYGRVELCFVDAETRRPRRVPETFLNGIQHYREVHTGVD